MEHARSLGMSDEPIVRAMICACLKHPLHCTAILRRTCLGCSCASSVVSECFDSAMLPPAPCVWCCDAHVFPSDLVPRLWSRLTLHFRTGFLDLFRECCKMGLGDIPQITTSMIAAFCAQASPEACGPASPSSLLAVLRSPHFLSTHACPAIASALLHAAICFRGSSDLASACCSAAAATTDACCSGLYANNSGSGTRPASNDGSMAALAWCAVHLFVDNDRANTCASTCTALWAKLLEIGAVAGQARALSAVCNAAGAPALTVTQRMIRLLDVLPCEGELTADAACPVPWHIRHHLSWMVQADSEFLLQQLIPVWISRSSFRPLWVLQCTVQSPGDPLRFPPPRPTAALLRSFFSTLRRWAIARLVLLHVRSTARPEAVRCACCVLLFLAMGAVAHPSANRNALEFFRAMVEGDGDGYGDGAGCVDSDWCCPSAAPRC